MFATKFLKIEIKENWIPIFGSALITLGALIKIPFYPVPFTLQTLALYMIALTQSPKQAFYSANTYLLLATLGVPVFFFQANPYWWMGKCAGYLWAFPIASYWMAKMRSKIGNLFALMLGGLFILLVGFAWLIPFIGPSKAAIHGLFSFIPCELAKILIACSFIQRRTM